MRRLLIAGIVMVELLATMVLARTV